MPGPNILIVEDEVIVAKSLENKLSKLGYNVVETAISGEEAILAAKTKSPDLVLMDIKLKGEIDGIEAAEEIRKGKNLPVIYLTSYSDDETFQRAKNTEPFGYLIKPFDEKELQRTIEIALYKSKLANELIEAKQRYERAVEAGKAVVWEIWIDEMRFIADNIEKTLSGYTVKELGNNFEEWLKIIHPGDLETTLKLIEKIKCGKIRKLDFECRIIRKDGTVRWILNQGKIVENEVTGGKKLIGTSTDITERKQWELALKESEERFRTIFENSGIGMSIVAPKGYFLQVNKSFAEIFGYTQKEMKGLSLLDLSHPSEVDRSINILNKFRDNVNLSGKQYEKKYVKKNGETFWGLINISPIRDDNGKVLYFIGQLLDITDRKKSQVKLAKYTEELKELNNSKDKFFSIISHDLRSPFNALLGTAEYTIHYLDEMSKDEIKESIVNIFNSTKKVYNFLNNLLEWAQLQTGRLEVEKTKLNLKILADETVDLISEMAHNKNINLKVDIPEDLLLYADPYMIETVLRNLVSNGIKFTNAGGTVSVSANVKNGEAEVIVADTGIGISPENQKKLFRIDEQFRVEGTANEKGTGLGLILCKELVEKNKGTIRVESEEGIGSRFIFTVPLFNENIG